MFPPSARKPRAPFGIPGPLERAPGDGRRTKKQAVRQRKRKPIPPPTAKIESKVRSAFRDVNPPGKKKPPPSLKEIFDLTPEEALELANLLHEECDRHNQTKESGNRHIAWNTDDWVVKKYGRPTWIAFPKREPRVEDFLDQFDGKNKGVGSYLSNADGTINRLVFDIDKHETRTQIDADYNLWRLRQQLYEDGVPCLVERSKSANGYHVEIRFKRGAVPTNLARRFGKILAWRAGLYTGTDPSLAKKTIEVYPKQDTLDGRLGNQVARPGSRYWFEKTGGSVYLDKDLEPVPMSEWAKRIRRSIIKDPLPGIQAYIDLFGAEYDEAQKPKKHAHVHADGGHDHAEEAPAYKGERPSIDVFLAALDQAGVEVERVEGYSGFGYTHKITPAQCPNWKAHSKHTSGAAGVGGAVFLFGPERGFGFKCMHHHCGEMSWKDARQIIDPDKRIRFAPARRRPRRKEKSERERHIDTITRRHFRLLGDRFRHLDGDENKAIRRLANRLFRVATCGLLVRTRSCDYHGPGCVHNRPCDDTKICPWCVMRRARIFGDSIRTDWRTTREIEVNEFGHDKKITVGGHERVCYAFWPVATPGDRRVLYDTRKMLMGGWDKCREYKPRFRTAPDGIHLFWPPEGMLAVPANWKRLFGDVPMPELRWVSVDEAAKIYERAVISVVRWFFDQLREAALVAEREGPYAGREKFKALAIQVSETEWFTQGNWKLQGSGKMTAAHLPVKSLTAHRKEVNDRIVKERGGIPANQCAELVRCEDGLRRPCGRYYRDVWHWGPTGVIVAKDDAGDQEGKAAAEAVAAQHVTDYYQGLPPIQLE